MRQVLLVLGFGFLLLAIGWAVLAALSDSDMAWGFGVLSVLTLALSAGWILFYAKFDKTPAGRRAASRSHL